jgi:hypothetical protein
MKNNNTMMMMRDSSDWSNIVAWRGDQPGRSKTCRLKEGKRDGERERLQPLQVLLVEVKEWQWQCWVHGGLKVSFSWAREEELFFLNSNICST